MNGSAHRVHSVRLATVNDADEIARLLTMLGHPTMGSSIAIRWAEWLAEGNFALVADGESGTLAGVATLHRMAVLHRPKSVGRITALAVDASARRCGMGRALVANAEQMLADRGCGLIEITSHARLTDAHAFYEHLGYQRTSVRFAKVLVAGNASP